MSIYDNIDLNVLEFLKSCQKKDSIFSWCKKGVNSKYDGCLGVQSLALKIIYILGLEKHFNIDAIGDSILRYQNSNGFFINGNNDSNQIRAETRQALSALKNYNIRPKYALEFMGKYNNCESINSFFSSFDWRNPWAAGSHVSHMMFFLDFCEKGEINEWICSGYLPKLWRGNGWYVGEKIEPSVNINGMMKVISGLVAAKMPIQHGKDIIEYCLGFFGKNNACNIMDIIFCLYYCSMCCSEFDNNICDIFRKQIIEIEKHWKGDGFSFFQKSSQTKYLGFSNITTGMDEGDIHGTVLFLWAMSLINDKLGMGYNLRIQTT